MLFLIMMKRHFSVPPGPVHRVDIRIEEYLVEVPDDDCERSQHCLVIMYGGRDIEPPPRQMISKEHFPPQHDARAGHDEHAPDQRPVFPLLRVIEAGGIWPWLWKPQGIGQNFPCAPHGPLDR